MKNCEQSVICTFDQMQDLWKTDDHTEPKLASNTAVHTKVNKKRMRATAKKCRKTGKQYELEEGKKEKIVKIA